MRERRRGRERKRGRKGRKKKGGSLDLFVCAQLLWEVTQTSSFTCITSGQVLDIIHLLIRDSCLTDRISIL
jgi:hypothetical protein